MSESAFIHAAVAIDQSEAGELIVESLKGFKKFGTKKITLITVISVPHEAGHDEFDTQKSQQRLHAYKQQLENDGFDVETELRVGTYFYAPTEILESAAAHDADFIIIGSRGQSKVQEMLLGSTASEVLQRSEFPVFLLKIDIEKSQNEKNERSFILKNTVESSLNHVLHATDFSETASRAFDVVKSLDRSGKINKLSMIHVQGHHAIALKDPASRERLNEQITAELEKMRNSLSDATRNGCDLIITFGTPGKEIIQAAEENGVTLTVMGSQGKGFVHEFFLGGVSSQVTRFSQTPVLVVPAKR